MSNSAISGPILSDTRRAPAGTAAAPSFAFNDSTGTGVYLVSPGVLGLSTAGVQRVVVDASGNVGIGTASPGGALGIARAAGVSAFVEIAGNGNTPGAASLFLGQDSASTGYIWNRANSPLTFGTNGTERMRLDASGNLGIGAHPSQKVHIHNGVCEVQRNAGTGNATYYALHHAGSTYVFHNISSNVSYDIVNNGNGVRLPINGNSWGAISDERKKKNIKPLEYGLAQISAIKPVRFDYKTEESDDSARIGFIAQELLPVVKEAVQGSEDTEYSVTSTDLIPVLVKAIQELEARLAALEAK